MTLDNRLSRYPILACLAITLLLVFSFSAWLETRKDIDAKSVPIVPIELQTIQQRQAPAFDLSKLTIPSNEIRSGGPPKDGIPALMNPQVVAANDARFLKAGDRVIGVTIAGKSRAYPITILNYHEIINDKLGDAAIAVTYCPLCDSAVVFDRKTPLGVLEFGVSGFLYNSNVLMFDRSRSESLWSQMMAKGVSGSGADQSLSVLPFELTSWNSWQRRNPDTDVVSVETGHKRNYKGSPYSGYFKQPNLMFPVQPLSNSLPLKEPVLGVWVDQVAIAFPKSLFGNKDMQIERTIQGKKVIVAFDAVDDTIRIVTADKGLQWANSFWFAWYAFRPHTEISSQ